MEINFSRPGHGMLDIESTVTALSDKAASIRFKQAAERLLNVTKWHTLPCSLLPALRLTDEAGHNIERQARQNDYLVFNSFEGREGDWVKVEKLQFETNQDDSIESVEMCARPSRSPIEELIHYEDSYSPSNTIKVFRKGLNVTVAVHGHHEQGDVPGSLHDLESGDSRPSAALPGIARVQWRSLVNCILSTWK